jgi:hypothetical protein
VAGHLQPGIASDVARLVDGARANGDLVVWVLHSERVLSKSHISPGNLHWRLRIEAI